MSYPTNFKQVVSFRGVLVTPEGTPDPKAICPWQVEEMAYEEVDGKDQIKVTGWSIAGGPVYLDIDTQVYSWLAADE